MSSAVSLSAFVFRDVLKFIFPTMLGLCLLAPIVNDHVKLDDLILLSIGIGYVGSITIAKPYEKLWLIKSKTEQIDTIKNHLDNRWNYTRLFYNLNKDDREYIYLTDAYISFYLLVSEYLFIYLLIIIFCISFRSTSLVLLYLSEPHEISFLGLVHEIIFLKIKSINDLSISAWIAFITSFALFRQTLDDYAYEYKILFTRIYPNFAENYHLSKGYIATSIWGKLEYDQEQHGKEIQLFLCDKNYNIINVANIGKKDNDGNITWDNRINGDMFFIFNDCFNRVVNENVEIIVEIDSLWFPVKLTPIEATTCPEIIIAVNKNNISCRLRFLITQKPE